MANGVHTNNRALPIPETFTVQGSQQRYNFSPPHSTGPIAFPPFPNTLSFQVKVHVKQEKGGRREGVSRHLAVPRNPTHHSPPTGNHGDITRCTSVSMPGAGQAPCTSSGAKANIARRRGRGPTAVHHNQLQCDLTVDS